MDRRQRLFLLLQQAAELEHSLICVYLYAGMSVNRTIGVGGLTAEQQVITTNWAERIILVARQEMEHLALVNNILSALGGAPHMTRPEFPLAAGRFPLALELRPISPEVIDSFRCWERPPEVPPETCCGGLGAPIHARHGSIEYTSIENLYEQIKTEIVDGGESLFIGPERAQVGGDELGLNFPRLGRLGGIYDITLMKVTDVASAVDAIDLIIAEGEGSATGQDESHYVRFTQIRDEMTANPDLTGFARPIATNPRLWPPANDTAVTRIEAKFTREVVAAFNDAYQLMSMLLAGFFAYLSEETEDEHADGIYLTFYPFMTMVMRPMMEVVTALPVKEGEELRAGPTFEYETAMSMLPHEDATLVVIGERLHSLHAQLQDLFTKGMQTPESWTAEELAAVKRLKYIARSVSLTTQRWEAKLGVHGMEGSTA